MYPRRLKASSYLIDINMRDYRYEVRRSRLAFKHNQSRVIETVMMETKINTLPLEVFTMILTPLSRSDHITLSLTSHRLRSAACTLLFKTINLKVNLKSFARLQKLVSFRPQETCSNNLIRWPAIVRSRQQGIRRGLQLLDLSACLYGSRAWKCLAREEFVGIVHVRAAESLSWQLPELRARPASHQDWGQ